MLGEWSVLPLCSLIMMKPASLSRIQLTRSFIHSFTHISSVQGSRGSGSTKWEIGKVMNIEEQVVVEYKMAFVAAHKTRKEDFRKAHRVYS